MINSRRQSPYAIAMGGGTIVALLVMAAIYFGSGQLHRFDSPLAAYAAATVFAGFAFAYRYIMWLQRPPTWKYFKAGWRLFLRPRSFVRNVFRFIRLLFNNIILQKFIDKRSHSRWIAHMGMAWGCILAFMITIPLSWGWLQFSIAPDEVNYEVVFMSIPMFAFNPHGIIGFAFFNGLNISAVLVLTGVAFAMHRRVFNHGAQAVQSLENDLIPLLLLFSVSITGLMITASYRLMGGANFSFISLLHAFTVIILLLWMPFGKLFHVVQRSAQLGVSFYRQETRESPQVQCARSGLDYQSLLHHDDLVDVMKEIGMDFGAHQNISPEEKRKLIALNQAAAIDGVPFVG